MLLQNVCIFNLIFFSCLGQLTYMYHVCSEMSDVIIRFITQSTCVLNLVTNQMSLQILTNPERKHHQVRKYLSGISFNISNFALV